MELSIAIQHHVARPELPDRLMRMILDTLVEDSILDGFHIETVPDPDPFGAPSPWRTAKLAWCRAAAAGFSHCMVIQDDAIPCAAFVELVAERIAEKPDDPLAFFFGRNSFPLDMLGYQSALASCERWWPLPCQGWVPCVCVVLPRDQALDLAGFHLPHHDRPSVADDEVMMEWTHARGLTAYATIPSLVEHDDSAVSTMGGHKDTIRQAVCFADNYVRGDVLASPP